VERGATGARWQRSAYDELLLKGMSPTEAAAEMLGRYRELSEAGGGVAGWPG